MIKPNNLNSEFEFGGINHVALVCSDMARTVDFYSNVLGMPLIKSLDLPDGMGQHFFFDAGGGNAVAFFWFPDAPDAAPGVASASSLVGQGLATSAHGSMNHLAFDVSLDKLEEYREKLAAKGVEVTEVVHHDASRLQVSRERSDSTFVSSIYFFDPDGVLLEFAAWTRDLDSSDVKHPPARASDRERYLAQRPAWPPSKDN